MEAKATLTFDWDAIEVGDYRLDHSQNFFARANLENDKNAINAATAALTLKDDDPPAQEQEQEQSRELDHRNGKQEQEEEEKETAGGENATRRPNLRLQWSPMQRCADGGGAGGGGVAHTPKAYKFRGVYESNREQALRRRDDEERKARQFHSRPMPNFKLMHNRLTEMRTVHKVTMPVTPDVVKHSSRLRKPDSQAQEEENRVVPLPTRPFNLRSEQRLRDRREFDAAAQAHLQAKKIEQDEQRKRCEQEEIKEIRKKTVFKARPNPFK